MKVVRILNKEYAKKFAVGFHSKSGYLLPYMTFLENATFAVKKFDNTLHGGMCFIEDKNKFRVLRQIPADSKITWINENIICELTAFWVDNKAAYIPILSKITWHVLWSKKKYFVYSYATDCRKLQDYYSRGKPILLYSGQMNTESAENVECLSKLGIVRIFVSNILKSMRFW
jgi:hypothetical protein